MQITMKSVTRIGCPHQTCTIAAIAPSSPAPYPTDKSMLAETMTKRHTDSEDGCDRCLAGEVGEVPSAEKGAAGQQCENHPDTDERKHHRIHTEIQIF